MIDLDQSVFELGRMWAESPTLQKTPNDLARYELILERVKPTVVLETGLDRGGSLHWFAARVPHYICVEAYGPAIIDCQQDAYGLGPVPGNAHMVWGYSHDVADEACAMARTLAVGGPILVVLDSDHGADTVYSEMRAFAGLVTPGSYMVVEDGIYHYLGPGRLHEGNWYKGDPVEAIGLFLFEHEGWWENDLALEDAFPTTQHPGGWLRRL